MMLAKGDILVVWENDDIDLPHYISTHVPAMEGRLWSKLSFVLSSYTGRLEQEDATGRFHAPSHRRYTGSRVFFAPWREDVFVTQRRNGDSTPDGSHHSACMRTQKQAIPPIRLSHHNIVTRERHGFNGIPKHLKNTTRTRLDRQTTGGWPYIYICDAKALAVELAAGLRVQPGRKSEMHHTIDAVYENGMFRPLRREGLAITEGTQVRITVDDEEMPEALRLATSVYDGLPDSAIKEVEEIALDRRNFSGRQSDQ